MGKRGEVIGKALRREKPWSCDDGTTRLWHHVANENRKRGARTERSGGLPIALSPYQAGWIQKYIKRQAEEGATVYEIHIDFT